MEIFEILRRSETRAPGSESGVSPPSRAAVGDKLFKIVIIAFLVFSVMIQIMVSALFHEKIQTLEHHLSFYPVVKPEEVDLTVVLPKLVEVNRKIDSLAGRLDRGMKEQEASQPYKGYTDAEVLSKPVRKKAETPRSIQVEVVERVKN